jgi:ribose transport system substrate-binding protein
VVTDASALLHPSVRASLERLGLEYEVLECDPALADTAALEAARHPNVQLEVIDAEFDDNKMGQVIDTWIAKQYDGIVLWPNREAPMGPPVDRAVAAGIPVVSLDRRTSSEAISSEVLGNF